MIRNDRKSFKLSSARAINWKSMALDGMRGSLVLHLRARTHETAVSESE